jgi:hypothetical protein
MTELPYDFDLLYDLKTVEQLHDHLTGRLRYSVSSTNEEIIETCRQYGVPLPKELITAVDANAPLARTVRGLSTFLDICVIQDALKEAQENLWEQTIKPMFADCKSTSDIRVVTDKILALRVDHDGTTHGFPDVINKKMDAEIKRIREEILGNEGPR